MEAKATAAGFGCGTATTGIDWLPADSTASASIWTCKTFGGIGVSVRSSEPAGVAWRVGWLSGPSRATRVRGDEWLPREVTGN